SGREDDSLAVPPGTVESLLSYLESRDREMRALVRQLVAALAPEAAERGETARWRIFGPPSLASRLLARVGGRAPAQGAGTGPPPPWALSGDAAARGRLPRVVPFPEATAGRKVIGITVFGLDEAAVAGIADTVVN